MQVSDENAVGWLIDTIRANPDDVTILAVGPLTNIALAMRTDPGIVPLIKRVIYMGGAVEVPGNVRPAAELNCWFDPEASKIVARAPIEHVVVPADVTGRTFDRPGAVVCSGDEGRSRQDASRRGLPLSSRTPSTRNISRGSKARNQ